MSWWRIQGQMFIQLGTMHSFRVKILKYITNCSQSFDETQGQINVGCPTGSKPPGVRLTFLQHSS